MCEMPGTGDLASTVQPFANLREPSCMAADGAVQNITSEVAFYSDSLHHVLAEIERVGRLVQLCAWRARSLYSPSSDRSGFCVYDREIEGLVDRPFGPPAWVISQASEIDSARTAELGKIKSDIAGRKAESERRRLPLRLTELARSFHLDPIEVDVLLLCLAPEIDLRYEKLYAYLQDDITRKRPSIDLVLNLISPDFEARLEKFRYFANSAPLIHHELVCVLDDPWQPLAPLPRRGLKLADRVIAYLLDRDDIDPLLTPYAHYVEPQPQLEDQLPSTVLRERIRNWLQLANPEEGASVYLHGPYGVGKQAIAEALCRESGQGLLRVELEPLHNKNEAVVERLLLIAGREARLRHASLYFSGAEYLLSDGQERLLNAVVSVLADQGGINFLAGSVAWEAKLPRGFQLLPVTIPLPTPSERKQLWSKLLQNGSAAEQQAMPTLANRFRLSGGQMRDAVATARNLAVWHGTSNGESRVKHLYAACRQHSNRKLEMLTERIIPRYGWNDIVLPAESLSQLREICNRMIYRSRIYEDWGFDAKLSLGKALNVLFTGPSGTGKTMAAEILARELGLDIYKIDLSTVVSKYIGETEKNLARIFSEAETSNAILFFDEADALFGKRSEVRDSHDRYANLEISYLLQRMEAYEGMAILASNLRKNMDEAFLRRLHFIVEFPFPGRQQRREIWTTIWPELTPRSESLDVNFLADRFELTGGSIRNVALAAAFQAAADGGVVTMCHVLQGIRREYRKMGEVSAEEQFVYRQEGRSPERYQGTAVLEVATKAESGMVSQGDGCVVGLESKHNQVPQRF